MNPSKEKSSNSEGQYRREMHLTAEREAERAFLNCGIGRRHSTGLNIILSPKQYAVVEGLRTLTGTGYLAVLLGPRGTGKTQMAARLLCDRFVVKELPDAPFYKAEGSAKYTVAADFFMDLKGCYQPGAQRTEQAVINDHTWIDLLVIDEYHVRSGSAWEDQQLMNLIDRRYREMLDTIIICNLDADKFSEMAGASIMSRANETGGIIVCDWPSFRTKE